MNIISWHKHNDMRSTVNIDSTCHHACKCSAYWCLEMAWLDLHKKGYIRIALKFSTQWYKLDVVIQILISYQPFVNLNRRILLSLALRSSITSSLTHWQCFT